MMHKICRYCGDDFETEKKNKVYCCIGCRETAKQKRRDIRNGRKNKSRKSGDFGVYLRTQAIISGQKFGSVHIVILKIIMEGVSIFAHFVELPRRTRPWRW